jgi:inward rectifier potassium channel
MDFSNIRVIEKAHQKRDFLDFFHWVLTLTWKKFLTISVGAYFSLNTLFALLYLAAGNEITNAKPGSFLDALAFSFQTSSTVGYGYLAPIGVATVILSMAELTISLFFVAGITGLFIARVSRPKARVDFSKNIVITSVDGVPTLSFRMANGRSTHVSNAHVKVVAMVPYRSREGHESRRFIDLKLFRSESPIFAFTWTVLHTIDESSPIRELAKGAPDHSDIEVFVSFTGFETALSQTVHAATRYRIKDILWNHQFEDIVTVGSDGSRTINLQKFHDTRSL